jgi:hypothetical protein
MVRIRHVVLLVLAVASSLLTVPLVSAPANAAVCSPNYVNTQSTPIPDGVGSASSTINFPYSDTVQRVIVDVTVDHTYNSDLRLSLVHGSTTVLLSEYNGGDGDGYGSDAFGDSYSIPITN